jgi:hypothetical protein
MRSKKADATSWPSSLRIQEEGGKQFIRGSDCPLAALTAHHPEACLIAESLLTEFMGVPVKEHCNHGERPRCCFEIMTSDSKAREK